MSDFMRMAANISFYLLALISVSLAQIGGKNMISRE